MSVCACTWKYYVYMCAFILWTVNRDACVYLQVAGGWSSEDLNVGGV